MTEMKAWSYSSLSNYLTCEYQYWAMRIGKLHPWEDTEDNRWGNAAHKAIELRFKNGQPLEERFSMAQPVVEKIAALQMDQVYVEKELCINKRFEPVGWWDRDGWARGKLDYLGIKDKTALTFDWKFGKRREGSRQLMMAAGLVFVDFPQVDTVKTAYVWFKEGGKIDKHDFKREEFATIWRDFLPDVKKMAWSYQHGNWPKRPSGLCKKHCAVVSCEHNGRFQR